MADWGDDPDVFVRSLASRGHLGGLSPTAARVIDVMDAAGKTVVIVETVGAGQSEVEVAEVADVKIVVCAPGLGDEVQAIKAGILEIADILVVNKADQPLAGHTKRLLEGMLKLRKPESRKVPVLATTATATAMDNTGIDALAEAVLARGGSMNGTPHERDPLTRVRVLLAEAAAELVKRDVVAADDPLAERLCRRVQRGDLDLESAARQFLSGGIDA
jgi:LAO/AO transport system kinase